MKKELKPPMGAAKRQKRAGMHAKFDEHGKLVRDRKAAKPTIKSKIAAQGFGKSIASVKHLIGALSRSAEREDVTYFSSNKLLEDLHAWAVERVHSHKAAQAATDFISELPTRYFDKQKLYKEATTITAAQKPGAALTASQEYVFSRDDMESVKFTGTSKASARAAFAKWYAAEFYVPLKEARELVNDCECSRLQDYVAKLQDEIEEHEELLKNAEEELEDFDEDSEEAANLTDFIMSEQNELDDLTNKLREVRG